MARKNRCNYDISKIKENIEFFKNHPTLPIEEKERLTKDWKAQLKCAYHRLYSKMPKSPQKDNQSHIDRYFAWIERDEHRWIRKGSRVFCKDCNHSQDLMQKCSKCGSENLVSLTPDARVPRKNANKRKWKNFIKNFVK
jgi:hypothetical protein